MSINTGSGNSGGPVFNKDGEVISILCSVRADWSATKFTYSVPAKYALKLMGTQTVIK
jgi:S1-C subfamily serine protease